MHILNRCPATKAMHVSSYYDNGWLSWRHNTAMENMFPYGGFTEYESFLLSNVQCIWKMYECKYI